MHCDVSFDSGEWADLRGHSQINIDFDYLNPLDRVVIRTRNSLYRFLVKNPAGRQGRITGGSLGDDARDALLIGSFPDPEPDSRGPEFRTGARVVFLIFSPGTTEVMATSPIEELFLIPADEGTATIA